MFALYESTAHSLAFLGTPEIILIGVGVLLLFGAKKIPELMKGLGGGVKEFKKAMNEEETQAKKEIQSDNKN